MRELTYKKKDTMQGNLDGVMRVDGKIVYFKANNTPHTQQMINNLRSKGADIQTASSGWIRVDMFIGQPTSRVILGGKEFDINETSEDEIELILYNFYALNFAKAGFEVKRSFN